MKTWHRQFVELSINGPHPKPKYGVANPLIRICQDRCFWLTPERCQTPGLVEWMKTASPGSIFVWYNPLDEDTHGGCAYICTDLWYEETK
jgi:hypothetical protein